MNVTYTWNITSLEKADINSTSNVVLQTYWELTGEAENGTTVIFDGATPLNYNPNVENFLPFEELTESVVIEWVKSQLIKDDAMEDLEIEIEQMIIQKQQEKNKENVSRENLPWSI